LLSEIMNKDRTTDDLRELTAFMVRIEASTVRSRYADINIQRKFNRMKRAVEEFCEAIRRSN